MSRRNRRSDNSANFHRGTVKLAQPDRSKSRNKTLLEIVTDYEAALTSHKDTNAPEEDTSVVTCMLYSATLAMIHFTLDVLVYHQFAQEIAWRIILFRTLLSLPVFTVITLIVRKGSLSKLILIREVFLLIFSSIAGCYLIHACNTASYLAVMKQAPPLGVLWIWMVVEMRLPIASIHLLIVGVYIWWNRFSIF